MNYQNKSKEELVIELDKIQQDYNDLISKYNDVCTKQQQVEEFLLKKEEELKIIAEDIPDNIIRYDLNCNAIYINHKQESELYFTTSLIGKKPLENKIEDIIGIDNYQKKIQRVLKEGVREETEIILPDLNGNQHIFEVNIVPEQNKEGKIIGALAIGHEITERKKAEKEIFRMNRSLRMLSDTNQALIHITDEKQLLNEICRIAVEVGGYHMAWVGFAEYNNTKTLLPVAHAGFDSGYIESANITWADDEHGQGPGGIAVRTGNPCIVRNIPLDPSFAPWREAALKRGYKSIIALPLVSESLTYGAIGIYSNEIDAFDVKEVEILKELADDLAYGINSLRIRAKHNIAEAALIESEHKFRNIFSIMEEALSFNELVFDLNNEIVDYKILEVNPAFEKDTGLTREQAIGRNATEIFGISSDYIHSFWKTNLKSKTILKNELYIEHINAWKHISTSIPIDNKFVISYFDITERKLAEQELQKSKEKIEESEKKFKLIIQSQSEGIGIVNRDEIFEFVNLAAEKIFETEIGGLIGTCLFDFLNPGEIEKIRHQTTIRKEGKTDPYELEIVTKRGNTKYIYVSATPRIDENNNYLGAYGVFRDITEQKRNSSINESRLHLMQYAVNHSLDELLEETLNEAEKLTESQIGFYHFVDNNQKSLTLQNWSSKTKAIFCKAEGKGLHYDIADAGVWVDCVFQKRPVIHNDYQSLSYRKGMPEGHAEVVRELVVPVLRGDKTKAILGVGNKPTNYSNKDIEAISLLADLVWEIAERKLVEEALSKSEERYRLIFEHSPIGLLSFDEKGVIYACNNIFVKIIGSSAEKLIGLNMLSLPDKNLVSAVQNALNGNIGFYEGVYSSYTANKNTPVRCLFAPMSFDGIGAHGGVGIIEDITVRMRSEELLRKSEEKYRLIAENTADTIAIMDLNLKPIYVSPSVYKMRGFTVQEAMVQSMDQILTPTSLKKINTIFAEKMLMEANAQYEPLKVNLLELEAYCKDGSIIWVELSASFLRDKDLKPTGVLTIIRNISDRKQAEFDLNKASKEIRDLYNHAPCGYHSLDKDGIFVRMNDTELEWLGYNYVDVIGKMKFVDLLTPEGLKTFEENFPRFKATGIVRDLEFELIRKDKSTLHVLLSGTAITDENGVFLMSRSTVYDITDRKQTEHKLKESEERLRLTLEATQIGIWDWDIKNDLWYASPTYYTMLGYEPKIGYADRNEWLERLHPDDREYVSEKIQNVLSRNFKEYNYEVRMLHKNGKYYWQLVTGFGIERDNEGKVTRMLGTMMDINYRKKAEEILKEQYSTLRGIIDSTDAMIFSLDRQYRYTSFNYKHVSIMQEIYNSDIKIGDTMLAYMTNIEDREKAMQNIDRALKGEQFIEESFSGEELLSRLYFQVSHSPIRTEDGEIIGVAVFSQDITKRKQIEDALSHSRAELKAIYDYSPVIMCVVDEDRKVLYANNAFTIFTGVSVKNLMKGKTGDILSCIYALENNCGCGFGKNCPDCLLKNTIEDTFITGNGHQNFDFQITSIHDGITQEYVLLGSTTLIQTEKQNRLLLCLHDISKRKRAEKDLILAKEKAEESEQKYRLLSENITDGIFICKNGCFEYINEAMYDIFGYDKFELEGFKLIHLAKSEYHQELETFFTTKYFENQFKNLEIECIKKDSSTIFVEIFFNYVVNENIVYGVVHDITEKKQIQKNIVKAIIQTEEKEKAYFSKELHDGIGPLLSTIKLYLEWSQDPESNKPATEIISNAEQILEEALTTVKEISNKLSPHLLLYYGLTSAIQSFIDKLEETSKIKFLFQSNLSRRIDTEIEAALYRAIIECINNTVKHAKANNIYILLNDTDKQLQIKYKDDGIGFDFIKTLSSQKGLGLFNLQNRIQNIGGKITMYSQPGLGVDYQITINV